MKIWSALPSSRAVYPGRERQHTPTPDFITNCKCSTVKASSFHLFFFFLFPNIKCNHCQSILVCSFCVSSPVQQNKTKATRALVGQSAKSASVATSPPRSLSVLQYYYFLSPCSVLTAETAKYVKVDMADIVTGWQKYEVQVYMCAADWSINKWFWMRSIKSVYPISFSLFLLLFSTPSRITFSLSYFFFTATPSLLQHLLYLSISLSLWIAATSAPVSGSWLAQK